MTSLSFKKIPMKWVLVDQMCGAERALILLMLCLFELCWG